MAAIKAYFYKLRPDMPDVCEGMDIPSYLRSLKIHFKSAAEALEDIDPATRLPRGPVYYSDTPRDCFESPAMKKYELEDAISDCIRNADKRDAAEKAKGRTSAKRGQEKYALAELIARKAVADPEFREKLLAYNRVPQSWLDLLQPMDPEAKLDKSLLIKKLTELEDRDYSHPTNAKGARHPLARIVESHHFSSREKLEFVADYMIGRKWSEEASRAVRIGRPGDYQEFNRAHWLEQNGAFVLETVGDVLNLTRHFTKTHKLPRGVVPEGITQLEPGALKLDPKP